jgi:hypothetical protein
MRINPFLHFIHHNLHGPAEFVTVSAVIPALEEVNGGDPDDNKRENADKNDRTMYLVPDIEMEKTPETIDIIGSPY